MKLLKFRWSKVYESSEEELADFLQARHITAERFVADEFHKSEADTFDHDITLYCAEGSLTFRANDKNISLQPGDGLRVPAGTTFQIDAGMTGYVYYRSTTEPVTA